MLLPRGGLPDWHLQCPQGATLSQHAAQYNRPEPTICISLAVISPSMLISRERAACQRIAAIYIAPKVSRFCGPVLSIIAIPGYYAAAESILQCWQTSHCALLCFMLC